MKQKLCLLLTLFFIVFCCGCSQEGKIARNTKDLFTVYNAALDVTVSLGETEDSLVNKFSADQYTHGEGQSFDGKVLSQYEIRTGDRMTLTVHLTEGKVYGIYLDPIIEDDPERSPDELMLEAWQNAESDWYLKGGITALSPKEDVYRILGNPTWEMEHEQPILDKVTYSTYSFTENLETIPPGEDAKNAVASMAMNFLNDKLLNAVFGGKP